MSNPVRKSLEFSLAGRTYRIDFAATGDLPTIDHESLEAVLDISEANGPGTFRLLDVTLHDVSVILPAREPVRP